MRMEDWRLPEPFPWNLSQKPQHTPGDSAIGGLHPIANRHGISRCTRQSMQCQGGQTRQMR